jgi:hypothetical protein
MPGQTGSHPSFDEKCFSPEQLKPNERMALFSGSTRPAALAALFARSAQSRILLSRQSAWCYGPRGKSCRISCTPAPPDLGPGTVVFASRCFPCAEIAGHGLAWIVETGEPSWVRTADFAHYSLSVRTAQLVSPVGGRASLETPLIPRIRQVQGWTRIRVHKDERVSGTAAQNRLPAHLDGLPPIRGEI